MTAKVHEVIAELAVNNGRDSVRIVREADPGGASVEHRVVTTQRMADRLHEKGLISDRQHAAATVLRDAFERSGLAIARLNARPLAPSSRGEPVLVADEVAWGIYMRAMQAVGQWRLPLRQVVIDDMTPEDFGRRFRCAGLASLLIALERLERYSESTGYIAFGKAKPLPAPRQRRKPSGIIAIQALLSPAELAERGRQAIAKRWSGKK